FDADNGSMAEREVVAAWEARFTHDPRLFGAIRRTVLSETQPSTLAPPGSVDLAILANNVHTLMAEGIAERVFGEVFRALKPVGGFGIEQHRAASTGIQDPQALRPYPRGACERCRSTALIAS